MNGPFPLLQQGALHFDSPFSIAEHSQKKLSWLIHFPGRWIYGRGQGRVLKHREARSLLSIPMQPEETVVPDILLYSLYPNTRKYLDCTLPFLSAHELERLETHPPQLLALPFQYQ